MLEYLSSDDDKDRAQKQLVKALRAALPAGGKHMVGFPGPGKTREHNIRSWGKNSLYYAYSEPDDDDTTPRHWNSFGIFRPERRVQDIVVEVNIAVEDNSGNVRGFFARDTETGKISLMHTGGVGGGRKGIGKTNFLASLSEKPVPVRYGKKARSGLQIAALDDPRLAALIWRYVEKVDAFKRAMTSGDSLATVPDQDSYFPEFWGKKRGQRGKTIDYESYHGLIVDELKHQRAARRKPGETMDKDKLIDLFVRRDGKVTEVYEVKTSAQRQSLYTAIGQLMTHGWGSDIERTLIVPEGDDLTADCRTALKRLGIGLRRYSIAGTKKNVRIILGR